MTRQGKGGGPQRPMKGFRPGKEPPQIRKQRAKQQFGEVSASQERLIEMLSERSPEEARGLMRRWRIGLLVAGIVLAIGGGVLWVWSLVAGIVMEVLALVALALWWRLQRQREALDAMVKAVSGSGGRKSTKTHPRKKK
jgi:Flp pilus assembly protein TadB